MLDVFLVLPSSPRVGLAATISSLFRVGPLLGPACAAAAGHNTRLGPGLLGFFGLTAGFWSVK